MAIVKTFTTIVILFVAFNLIKTIYHAINMKFREGMDNDINLPPARSPSSGQEGVINDMIGRRTGASGDPFAPKRKKGKCLSGCKKHTDIDGNCDNKVYKKNGKYYRKCSYICPGPADPNYDSDQECEYAENCDGCGTFNIETDSKGYSMGSKNNKDIGLCSADWDGKPGKRCIGGKCYEKGERCDTNEVCKSGCCSTEYGCLDRPGGSGSGRSGKRNGANCEYGSDCRSGDCGPATQGAPYTCLNSADRTTDSTPSANNKDDVNFQDQGYPNTTWRQEAGDTQSVTQERLMKMGRKFLRDESNRKGIHPPAIMDSEAEFLGRLVMRVSKSEQNQRNAPNKSAAYSKTKQRESMLMNKLSEIYQTHSDSQKISQKKNPLYQNSTNVTTDNLSRTYAQNRTTGLMTDIDSVSSSVQDPSLTGQRDVAIKQSQKQLQISRSLNPQKTMTALGFIDPTARFKSGPPRNPNLAPSPYNSIMSLFQ